MSPVLDPECTSTSAYEWPLFDIPVTGILDYIARKTGEPVSTLSLHGCLAEASERCPDLQLAVKVGLQQRLHLNLGTPGIEEPDHPIEENATALYAGMLLGLKTIPVVLSGELEIAVEEGLIDEDSLERLRCSFSQLD